MNYFIVHKGSNLIQTVISSSTPPKESKDLKSFPATDSMLNLYYSLKKSLDVTLVDIGSILKHSLHKKELKSKRTLSDLTEEKRIRLKLYIENNPNMTDTSIANVFHVSVDAVSALRP